MEVEPTQFNSWGEAELNLAEMDLGRWKRQYKTQLPRTSSRRVLPQSEDKRVGAESHPGVYLYTSLMLRSCD